MTPSKATKIADGVHRCGTDLVSWYVIEEEGRLTVVDAGLPGYWPQFEAVLKQLGRSPSDVAALVLTHAHADHVGFAERARAEAGVPVWIHEADAEMARTGKSQKRRDSGSLLPYLRSPTALRLFAHFARNGGARIPPVQELRLFSDGETLEVPGGPTAILAPGHTEGLCALDFGRHGALIVGDVMCSRNPLTGRLGPQTMPRPFNVDTAQAIGSLDRLSGTNAATVLFGHGDPWEDGVTAAIECARAAGPT